MNSGPKRPSLAAWIILGAGLLLSVVAYLHFHHRTAEDAVRYFEEESRDAQRAMEIRLASYSSLLLGLRGLHVTSGGINARAFADYLGRLELPQRYPAVRSMDYIEYAGARTRPLSLTYAGPYGGDAQLRGEGSVSPETNPKLFDETRNSGDFVLAGRPISGHADVIVPLRLAVYDRHAQNGAQGGAAFVGSVGMHLSLSQVIEDAVSMQTLRRMRIAVHALGRQSHLGVQATADNLLIDTATMGEIPGQVPSPMGLLGAPLSRSSRAMFGGEVLEFEFNTPAHVFAPLISQLLPVFVLLTGVVISLLLFSLVKSLSLSQRRLEFSVAERIRDLEAVNQALQEEVSGRHRLEQEIFHLNVEERRRFSHELQDNIGQRLTAVAFMLESIAAELKPDWPEGHDLASRAGAHVSSAVAHTRLLARGLNPVAVEQGGLVSALMHLASGAAESFRVDCRLEHDGSPMPSSAVLQHNLYRIAQQAITNAVTHGRASRIVIELSNAEGRLRLVVVDNGIGLGDAPARGSKGLGLKIMRYRCSVLGLAVRIESPAGGGTHLVIEQNPAND